jgi:hypothetical protein
MWLFISSRQAAYATTGQQGGPACLSRIRLMSRADSSDFAKNPAAGLSSISSL